MPVILFAPAIAILMTLGIERVGAVSAVAWALGGYVFWTLTEYWMHRIVFHFEPEDGIGARLHWIIHGVHHDHPNDPMRLVMPPSVSVPLGDRVLRAVPCSCSAARWRRRSAPASSCGYLTTT